MKGEFSVDDLRILMVAANNDLIEKFNLVRDRIEVALNQGSKLEDNVRDLLKRTDDRIEDLVKKITEVNGSIPQ